MPGSIADIVTHYDYALWAGLGSDNDAPDYRGYFESIRVPFYLVVIVIQIQPIPLVLALYDVPLGSGPLLSNLIIAFAVGVGLIARKHSIDAVLVCLCCLGIVVGMVASNDHEATRALIESLGD